MSRPGVIASVLTGRIGRDLPSQKRNLASGPLPNHPSDQHHFSQQPTHRPREEPTMTTPTARKLTRFQYAASLLGALAFVALAPATAHATDNEPTPGGGCHYTDADGYDIPIDEGQDVVIDRKIVSCRGGTIVVTNPPKRGVGNVRGPLVIKDAPVLTTQR